MPFSACLKIKSQPDDPQVAATQVMSETADSLREEQNIDRDNGNHGNDGDGDDVMDFDAAELDNKISPQIRTKPAPTNIGAPIGDGGDGGVGESTIIGYDEDITILNI
jgi:hypothetical protein